ncbi:PEP-CTERM sorting domain-containing protein [uncultured Massilia sp.]|uniref:PEP-CTERM sorting domain-containing protein n=1 Tax=uncultured Massilia sp. TaxID=169973 RepID=UPI0025ED1A9F|nr:PEP-CTERM sorting domain-containing protein [uncultured Massilia sp.]
MLLAPVLLPAAVATARADPLVAPPRYAVTVVGGIGSVAYDVNLHGVVVGQLAAGDTSHAFVYADGTLRDLDTGEGAASAARHVNDHGQVVGSIWSADSGRGNGFLYEGGSLNRLDGSFSAYGINNSGTITGSFGVAGADGFAYSHAYSYAGGVYTDAGTLIEEAGSYGYAINDTGAITGAAEWARGGNWPTNVILYQDGVLSDLGGFAGPWAYGYSINDAGHVVGSGTIENIGGNLYPRRALLYADGVLQNLGSLAADADSMAYDINNLGQIVGSAVTDGGLHGFLYEDGAMVDLNALIDPAAGWTIRDAQAINDVAQIAGTACKGELCYAVRLDLVSQVPEPGSWAMAGIGLGVVALARRRGRAAASSA